MALTSEQQVRASAWAKVFEDGPTMTAVFDDMQEHIAQMQEPLERAGAMALLLYILRRRAQLRREQRKEKSR